MTGLSQISNALDCCYPWIHASEFFSGKTCFGLRFGPTYILVVAAAAGGGVDMKENII